MSSTNLLYMINLEEHRVYVDSHKMEMVPYTVVLELLKEIGELQSNYQDKLEEAMGTLQESIDNIDFDD